MARFQRKAKYSFGKITNVRVDGTFDIKYDNGKDEVRVDKSLIIKPESEREIARGTKIGVNEEQKAQAVSMKEQQRQELQDMQDRHDQLVAEELAAQAERDKDPGRPMGSDCDSQACGACKLIVDEFGEQRAESCSDVGMLVFSQIPPSRSFLVLLDTHNDWLWYVQLTVFIDISTTKMCKPWTLCLTT
jgi:hypothetical protein